jgi:glyceraldehyde 3-phosphate dehydrogenase
MIPVGGINRFAVGAPLVKGRTMLGEISGARLGNSGKHRIGKEPAVAIKVGINGFGRIGRQVLKAGLNRQDIEFVAVNDLTDAHQLAHLFKYDSTHGRFDGEVKAVDGNVVINGRTIKVVAEKDPTKLPWGALGVDIVIESTGHFTDTEKAKAHLTAGAKKVIISAPATGDDLTIVMGVNHDKYDPQKHHIVSNASCTTNALAPLCKVLNDQFGIVQGLMTTIHSYTNDQRILDAPHKDPRRARSAAVSMIPTSTGAAKALHLVIPELKGKLNGVAIRVPTPDASLIDLTVELGKTVTAAQVNQALRDAAPAMGDHILMVSDEPLVSVDYIGNAYSSTIDAELTMVIGERMVKVFAWYDNEWGYSSRVVDLAAFMAQKMG